MNQQNPNNFHWTKRDASEIVTTLLTTFITDRGYKIESIKISAELTNRRNKLSLTCFIDILANKDGNVLKMVNYDSYCQSEGIICTDFSDKCAIAEFIKNLLQPVAASCELSVEQTKPVASIQRPEIPIYISSDAFENLEFSVAVQCEVVDIVKFLSDPVFIKCWAPVRSVSATEIVLFDTVHLKYLSSTLNFTMKMAGWDDWATVSIAVSEGNLLFRIRNIPSAKKEQVKNFWMSAVIAKMSSVFGFSFK